MAPPPASMEPSRPTKTLVTWTVEAYGQNVTLEVPASAQEYLSLLASQ